MVRVGSNINTEEYLWLKTLSYPIQIKQFLIWIWGAFNYVQVHVYLSVNWILCSILTLSNQWYSYTWTNPNSIQKPLLFQTRSAKDFQRNEPHLLKTDSGGISLFKLLYTNVKISKDSSKINQNHNQKLWLFLEQVNHRIVFSVSGTFAQYSVKTIHCTHG